MSQHIIEVKLEHRGRGRNLRFSGWLYVDGIYVYESRSFGHSRDAAQAAANEWQRSITLSEARRHLVETRDAHLNSIKESEDALRQSREALESLTQKLIGWES